MTALPDDLLQSTPHLRVLSIALLMVAPVRPEGLLALFAYRLPRRCANAVDARGIPQVHFVGLTQPVLTVQEQIVNFLYRKPQTALVNHWYMTELLQFYDSQKKEPPKWLFSLLIVVVGFLWTSRPTISKHQFR